MAEFNIITQNATTELEIKKSRFIATVAIIDSKESAQTFIKSIKEKHKSATHNCWAYVVGDPNGANLGMSDDGEPQGTAGRPMLGYLQHALIGNVAVVVTRYSSGVKLGTGGLVRAYTASTQQVIAHAKPKLNIVHETFTVSVPYAFDECIRNIIESNKGELIQAEYSHIVLFTLSFPVDNAQLMRERIISETNGVAIIDTRAP